MREILARHRRTVLASTVVLIVSLPAAARTFPYRVLRRVALPGTSSVAVIAVNPSGRSIYVAQGNLVRVYASGDATLRAQRRLDGPVSALVVTAGGELAAVVRDPGQLEFLDHDSLRVLRRRALRWSGPGALLYDPRERMLFLESTAQRTIVRLDPSTAKPLGSVRLAGALGQMAANGRGTLYVTNATHDALDVIDARAMHFEGAIALSGCHAPSGLAMDPIGRRLFVACANGRALIVDADLGFTFVNLPIQRGEHLRVAFAFHPLGPDGWKGGAFTAGGGAVTAIQMQAFVRYRDGGRLVLARCCTALALAPRLGELWLARASTEGKPATLTVLTAAAPESP